MSQYPNIEKYLIDARNNMLKQQNTSIDKMLGERDLLLEELKSLREVIIKQNQLGATWHADIFGELMACLASSNQLIQQIEGKEDGQEVEIKA